MKMNSDHDSKKSKAKSALGDDPFAKTKSSYVSQPKIKVASPQEETPQAEHAAKAGSEKTEPQSEPINEHSEDFNDIRKTLNQLGEELDEFHKDPRAYDRKKLESVVKEFVYELKSVLADSGYFARIQESLKPEARGLKDRLFELRRLFRAEDVDDYGLDRQLELTIKPFFDFLYYKYFRVDVKGIENIPYEGSSILVSNHSGVIPWDGAMLKIAIFNEHPGQRELRFLVDDFVFHFPFMGTMMNRIGGIRACPENADRLLQDGELIAVFPEGIKGISKLFKDRYRLERFGRGGVIRLALKNRTTITPVAVIGAEEIYPLMYKSHILARPLGLPFIPVTPLFPFLGPLGAVPLPTKWSIEFGKPISYEKYTSKDLNDGILINQKTAELRKTIQTMIKKGIESRRSIFDL